MNELEALYKQHKDSLDRIEPKSDSWDAIQNSLKSTHEVSAAQLKEKATRFPTIKVAAMLLAIIGLSSIFILNRTPQKSSVYYSLNEASENKSLVDPTGDPAPFDPSENKFTLVQFWSSGNALCVEENCYYYLPAYEKYKEKGFEIYAVSLDSELSEWVSGIEENDLPWSHASDLKGWDSPICTECNISKVPASYLLNEQGELVAKDLDASELENTLADLFAEN